MTPIEKIISIAEKEVGYLEKKSNSNLNSQNKNAGYNNYTKYWADIYPSLQGEAWCACFVTWVFTQAFGKEMTKKLLKHYPYIRCATMGNLFNLNANPKVGDIVLFYRGGRFAHTGIVTSVKGDYFTTIEGNTSGGSSIEPNGGGVFAKSYYNSKLPGTKFVTVDWSLVEDNINNFTEIAIDLKGKIICDLYIRSLPTTNSDIIDVYPKNTEVQLIAQTDNNWFKTNLGYISGKYVEIIKEITQEEFNIFLEQFLYSLSEYEPDTWSQSAREYVEKEKIIKGDQFGWKKYKTYLTREQLAQILYNIFGKKDEN